MNRLLSYFWIAALCSAWLLAPPHTIAQERAGGSGTITGVVTDAENGEPLPGANVVLLNTSLGTSTGVEGQYALKGVPAASYTMKVTFIGYESDTQSIALDSGESLTVDVALKAQPFVGDEVVVTGTKQTEKLLDAPVQIEAISAEDLDVSGGGTYLSALSTIKGVDFVNVGINGQGISARGFNNHFNTRMLQMNDGRVAQLPGTGLPQGNFLPTSELDVKSIEVVVGPASALYGPNAHTGVVNVISKDPWDESGLAFNIRGGQQSLLDVNGRAAGTFSENFGWKVTGQYMSADDFRPPTGGPNAAASDSTHYFDAANVFNETELVEDYDITSIRTEASLYYMLGNDWKLTGAYGFSENDNFGLTNNGRNRILGWQVQYQNVQLSHENFYAQVTHTSNDAGDTYQINGVGGGDNGVGGAAGIYLEALQTGSTPDEARGAALSKLDSLRQANRFVDKGQLWDSELQFRETISAGGEGTLDIVTGGQLRRYLPNSEGTFLADANGEDISATEVGGYVQVDYRPTEALRLNAAARVDNHSNYGTQFSPKAAVVYTVVPNHNVRFGYNRAFKSPTILESNLLINDILRGNIDGFTLRSGNTTDAPVIGQVDPLEPEQVNSIEVGYKGVFGRSLFVDVVAYNSWYENFISPLSPQSDGVNVFAFTDDDQLVGGSGVLLTYVNFGQAIVRGLDVGANAYLNEHFNLSGNVSLIELADFEEDNNQNALLLNVPTTKIKGTATMRDLGVKGWFLSASGRWHSAYEFASGSYWVSDRFYDDGQVPGRFTMGLTAGYTIPTTGVQVKASVSNLFDTDTPDVLGAPVTGRLFWMSATYSFDGLRF